MEAWLEGLILVYHHCLHFFVTCLLTTNSIAVKLIAPFGIFVPCLLCTQGKWREALLQDRSDSV